MAILTTSWKLDLGCILLGIFFMAYLYAIRNFRFWKKLGVRHKPPVPFIGNLWELINKKHNLGTYLAQEYRDYEGERFTGIYAFDTPHFVVRDLELIKAITVKDFNYFVDRNFSPSEEADPLSKKNLFALTGQRWRDLRAHLSPTFTSGKMKRMFHLVDECSRELVEHLDRATKNGTPAEVKELSSRYTTDVIASCAFGLEIHSIADPDSDFRKYLKQIFTFDLLKNLKFTAAFFAPHIIEKFKIRIFETDSIQFIRNSVWNTVKFREEHNIVRNDFLDLLMQLRRDGSVEYDDEDRKEELEELHATSHYDNGEVGNHDAKRKKIELEGDDFVAQAFIFFTAGFETSSTTITFALYELAVNPECQKKLREEVIKSIDGNNGKFSYSILMNLKYLDFVIKETLRLYPILPFLDRKVQHAYKVPGTEIVLDKGMSILIPVLGLHMDPKIFENPEKFDPERFSDENKRNIPRYAYLPFGEGPRNCIGNRMGLMQVKVGLARILYEYEVCPCSETPIPLKVDTTSLLLAPDGGVPLLFKKTKV